MRIHSGYPMQRVSTLARSLTRSAWLSGFQTCVRTGGHDSERTHHILPYNSADCMRGFKLCMIERSIHHALTYESTECMQHRPNDRAHICKPSQVIELFLEILSACAAVHLVRRAKYSVFYL